MRSIDGDGGGVVWHMHFYDGVGDQLDDLSRFNHTFFNLLPMTNIKKKKKQPKKDNQTGDHYSQASHSFVPFFDILALLCALPAVFFQPSFSKRESQSSLFISMLKSEVIDLFFFFFFFFFLSPISLYVVELLINNACHHTSVMDDRLYCSEIRLC